MRINFLFQLAGLLCMILPLGTTAAEKPWKAAPCVSAGAEKPFAAVRYGNPFGGSNRSILDIAPEAAGLEGVRLPLGQDGRLAATTLRLRFDRAVRLVVAAPSREAVAQLGLGRGVLETAPLLKRALSVTELPALDLYGVRYAKGEHAIEVPAGAAPVVILGAIAASQRCSGADCELADGSNYAAFTIEGFAETPALFTIVGGQDAPVVDEGMPGTETIQGGFEGGRMIKLGDTYHMFPTERAGEIGHPAKYDRIKTRIGHWTSKDAIHWERQSTLYQASGVYAVTHDDNPMNDRRAAIWSYMPIFNKAKNRWQGHYLAYTCDSVVAPNHSFGRIWRCESEVEGIEGIGGPYRDCGIVIEPGLDSQLWEGRQGVASFYPYQVGDKWYAFISGAYPYQTKEDYPLRGRPTHWYVGLAQADDLEGPWTRMKELNPITSIHPRFVENPIVSQLPNGLYIAVFDGGPEWLRLPNMIAYTLSKDGIHWSEAHYLPIDTKVAKWWDTMRTPLGLIDEGDDLYTIVYAAIDNNKRFHPMGMVQVKLNRDALEQIAKKL